MKNTVGLKTVTNQKQDKKLWIKTSKGEFTAMNLVKIEQNDNSYYTYYKAELHNDTQMTVADLKNQMGGYVGDSSQAVFDDIEEGKNIDFFSEKRALKHFGKGEEYCVIAIYDNLMNIVKKKSYKTSRHVTVPLEGLKSHLFGFDRRDKEFYAKIIELNPVFQRGNVWTQEQQITFVENFIRNPQSVNKQIYFNDGCIFNKLEPNAENSYIAGKYCCLDGLQRLTALLDFIDGKFAIFDGQLTYEMIEDSPNKFEILSDCMLDFNDMLFKTNQEVIDFYVDFNSAGTVHSQEEIERVKSLLGK